MPPTEPPSDTAILRSVEVVREHPARADLARFSWEVLSRQAAGRLFYAGKDLAASRAKDHQLDRERAETSIGNVLAIVERGPESEQEAALLSVLAVLGFAEKLDALPDEEREVALSRFVGHAVFIEQNSPYSLFSCVEPALDEADAARVYQAVATAVLEDAHDASLASLGRTALRIGVLKRARSAAARAALTALRSESPDPEVRLLTSSPTSVLPSSPAPEVYFEGMARAEPRTFFGDLLRWCTGWAIVSWVARALLFLLGVRRTVRVSFSEGRIRIDRQTRLLGKVILERNERFLDEGVRSVERRVRYPGIAGAAGMLFFAAGWIAGSVLFFDGARTGEGLFLFCGAAVIATGIVLDIFLDLWIATRTGSVSMCLRVHPKRRITVAHVPMRAAEDFLRALSARRTSQRSTDQGRAPSAPPERAAAFQRSSSPPS